MANVWPLAMLFAGLAVLVCGPAAHAAAPVTAIASGTLVGMYVIDLVGKLADPVEPLRALSAFKYYGSAIQDGIDPLAFAGLTARRHRAGRGRRAAVRAPRRALSAPVFTRSARAAGSGPRALLTPGRA